MLDFATEQFLKVDDYILADYSHPDGEPVNFYVASFASQQKTSHPIRPLSAFRAGAG